VFDDPSDEAIDKINRANLRILSLNVAQRLLLEGKLELHNYLDEARKMNAFLSEGIAPLPDEHLEAPDDISELDSFVPAENGMSFDDWALQYPGEGSGTMDINDGDESMWNLPEGAKWIPTAPEHLPESPPDEEPPW
jgi:hypothetical protein